MNKNDFKNPLIQSGAVLLVVFVLIAIVGGSESQGFWGSIGTIFSTIISGFVFLVGICFAIVFSIFFLIVIFIAAVSIYSVDRGKEMWQGFTSAVAALFQQYVASNKRFARLTVAAAGGTEQLGQTLTDADNEQLAALAEKLGDLDQKMNDLNERFASHSASIKQLRQQVEAAAADGPAGAHDTNEGANPQAFDERFARLEDQLASGADAQNQFEQQFSDELEAIKEDLRDLHEKTSIPETISGILSYIDLPEDRDLVTEKAKEAISRGMTYAQIDDFFKDSLKPEVYEELASHPRLTKDFLRSIKKQF